MGEPQQTSSSSSMVEVQGATVFVRDSGGSGPPVLLLHGVPDTGAMWDTVVAALGADFRVIVPDLPGFGQSYLHVNDAGRKKRRKQALQQRLSKSRNSKSRNSKSRNSKSRLDRGTSWAVDALQPFDWSVANRGETVRGILAGVGLEPTDKVIVVVHDHGGPFGLSFAVQYPDSVAGLLITNTVFSRTLRWHPLARQWRTPVLGEAIARMMTSKLFLKGMLWRDIKWRMKSKKVTGADIDHMVEGFGMQGGWPPGMLPIYRHLDPEDFAEWDTELVDLIGSNRFPTEVIWGKDDIYLTTDFAEELREHAKANVSIIEGSHWVGLENPELMADTIRALSA